MREDNIQEQFDYNYKIKHHTYFGHYVAVVHVNKRTKRQLVLLYEGVPEVKGFWGLIRIKFDPIRQATAGPTTNIHQAIKKMVTDYELPLHQQAKAEAIAEEESFLSIDYEAEIKKRRERLQLEEEEETAAMMQEPITFTDYQDDEQHILGREEEATNNKKGVHENSLLNLKQYQHLKEQQKKYKKFG